MTFPVSHDSKKVYYSRSDPSSAVTVSVTAGKCQIKISERQGLITQVTDFFVEFYLHVQIIFIRLMGKPYKITPAQEFQGHRMDEIGRDLCRSSTPTPCFEQGQL